MTIKELKAETLRGERIVNIASSFMYVTQDAPVHSILEELKEPYRNAIAVVDADMKTMGIIVPQDLVEMLGKPFGRDLLQRQSARDIMREAPTFRFDEYIQEIRERIRNDIESDADRHYLLVDGSGKFRGHFSALDILLYTLTDNQRELKIAATIQSRIVPPYQAVRGKKTSITCSSVMAQGTGGDFYHIKEYEPGKWFFCLCDISGKGISAAIITAVLSGFFFGTDLSQRIEDLIESLNRLVVDTFRLEKYLTGFFARFDEATGELEYCDMGHAYFFAIEGSAVQRISQEADNVPVGLVAKPEITVKTLRLAGGTALLLLSDGMIEQENRRGETFEFGEVGKCVHDSLSNGEDLVKAKIRILERFFSFKKDVPQHDDISLLLFHFQP